MKKLLNLKDFDDYVCLNEDLIHGEQNICNRAFINGGLITFNDGSSVHPKEIVNVVNDALMYLNEDFSRTFIFAKNTLNIIYLAHSNKYKTMAVDKNMNLYMNAGFIYHILKMDKILISAVIMHEVFHALFNHIERGTNWLAANGKSKTPQTWHDTNLAADVEVNQTLVRIGIIEEDRLINEIGGMYLRNVGGDLGQKTNVVPMEIILNDEKYMAKLRSMCPPPPDPEQGKQDDIETTDDWNNGYKDAWNKIAGLIKKYGYKQVWQKLQDAGIINSVGEINMKKDIEDINNLNYIYVKPYGDFINESFNINKDDKGKTYDDGYMTAFGKIISRMNSAINSNKTDESGDNNTDGITINLPQYKTDLKDDDLDEIDIPNNGGGDDTGSDNDGLPEKFKNDNKESNSSDKKGKEKSYGSGSGKSDDELTDDDINKLADDIKKKTDGGTKTISKEQEIGIGGTGSFQDEGLTDDDLRDSGYSQEDIDEINKVRKQNEINNSKSKIEKAIEKMRRELPKGDVINKYLSAIEVESNKYKNLWKEILDEFLSKKTRRAGKGTPTGYNDWKRKSRIANGEYGVHRRDEAQDPQDVNVYVDVSGSVDVELLEIICKSLVIFTQEWEYSGLNICPWASYSNGVYKVEDFYEKHENEVSKEILDIVSKGISQCGGGTDAKAAIGAMLDVIEQTLNDEEKDEKDDVHIVITDGYFDFRNIEDRIKHAVMSTTNRSDVAEKAPENTFWMIYDASESLKEDWINEIKKGKLIFIVSDVVKNNG